MESLRSLPGNQKRQKFWKMIRFHRLSTILLFMSSTLARDGQYLNPYQRQLLMGQRDVVNKGSFGGTEDQNDQSGQNRNSISSCLNPRRHYSKIYYEVNENGQVAVVYVEPKKRSCGPLLKKGKNNNDNGGRGRGKNGACKHQNDDNNNPKMTTICPYFPFENCQYPGSDSMVNLNFLTCACTREGMNGTNMGRYYLRDYHREFDYSSLCVQNECNFGMIRTTLDESSFHERIQFIHIWNGHCVREEQNGIVKRYGCDFKWMSQDASSPSRASRLVTLVTDELDAEQFKTMECNDVNMCNSLSAPPPSPQHLHRHQPGVRFDSRNRPLAEAGTTDYNKNKYNLVEDVLSCPHNLPPKMEPLTSHSTTIAITARRQSAGFAFFPSVVLFLLQIAALRSHVDAKF